MKFKVEDWYMVITSALLIVLGWNAVHQFSLIAGSLFK